jgi:uncharacterized damage-inducible protein DinB
MNESIRPFYADWAGYNRRVMDALGRLTADDLALTVPTSRDGGGEPWPIWAVAGHTVGARVYWLCHVLGEPGAESTPFVDPSGFGWEDDPSTPRSADEITAAYASTWRVVDGCLGRWTPAMLSDEVRRGDGPRAQAHTRQSILLRLMTHEAYHAGEIGATLSMHGREPIDLWPASDWAAGASRDRREA